MACGASNSLLHDFGYETLFFIFLQSGDDLGNPSAILCSQTEFSSIGRINGMLRADCLLWLGW